MSADDPRVERWANRSFFEFEAISRLRGTGVVMRKIASLQRTRSEPWFAGRVDCFRHGKSDEFPNSYADAHVLERAPVIDPVQYLDWLRKDVIARGGRFVRGELRSFEECSPQFEVIVNCTALGARQLAHDQALHSSRLQVLTVPNPGLDTVVFDDGPLGSTCVVPHHGYVKIGAVRDEGSEELIAEERHTLHILRSCAQMLPGFSPGLADVLAVTRALRPERHTPRVERDFLPDGRTLVHNYGHGSMGFILSHGIAIDIAGY